MKTRKLSLSFAVAVVLGIGAFSGCESTDSGGSTQVSSSVYYGVGFYDPWYHGDYDYDYDVVVTPPGRPDGPSGGIGARPEHPIARPPSGSSRPPSASTLPAARPATRPAARPMPSIPSTPRVAHRSGGGGRRR